MAQHMYDLTEPDWGGGDGDQVAQIIDLPRPDPAGDSDLRDHSSPDVAGEDTAGPPQGDSAGPTEQDQAGLSEEESRGGDGDLARWAAAGDRESFEELYRRHAESAWNVAYAVTSNRDDAADAVAESFARVLSALETGRLEETDRFRSYLLATARNAAIDVVRRAGRNRSVDDLPAAGTDEAGDHTVGRIDATLMANAFRSLPERWRSVLWLTEVEGMRPSEAAGLLGVSANGAAQLAVRARAGLRERLLQAHLQAGVDSECRFTVDHLGAYVGDTLSDRDSAKVEQHLAGCSACEARQAELEDLGGDLRRAAVPLPAALAGLAFAHWRELCAGSARPRRAATVPFGAHRALMGASVGLLGVGIIGAAMLGQSPFGGSARSALGTPAAHSSGSHATHGASAAPGAAADPGAFDPYAADMAAAADGASLGDLGDWNFDSSLGGYGSDFSPTVDTPAATGPNGSGYWGPGYWAVPMTPPSAGPGGGGAPPSQGSPPPSSPPPPQVGVGANPAPLPAPPVSAGAGSQTGVSVGPVQVGTPPPPPPPAPLPGVSVQNPVTGGTTNVSVP